MVITRSAARASSVPASGAHASGGRVASARAASAPSTRPAPSRLDILASVASSELAKLPASPTIRRSPRHVGWAAVQLGRNNSQLLSEFTTTMRAMIEKSDALAARVGYNSPTWRKNFYSMFRYILINARLMRCGAMTLESATRFLGVSLERITAFSRLHPGNTNARWYAKRIRELYQLTLEDLE